MKSMTWLMSFFPRPMPTAVYEELPGQVKIRETQNRCKKFY